MRKGGVFMPKTYIVPYGLTLFKRIKAKKFYDERKAYKFATRKNVDYVFTKIKGISLTKRVNVRDLAHG